MNCPNENCGKPLRTVDQIFVCVNCVQAWRLDELHQIPWYEAYAQDSMLWHKQAFTTYPFVIAHEYERLQILLKEGQTYGVLIQLKDLFEVVLKFNVLTIIGSFYQGEKTKAQKEILLSLLEKPLSLGDWHRIALNVKKLKLTHPLQPVLKDLVELYEKEMIVHWRNQTIGHGALGFDSDNDFQFDIKKKLKLVCSHFQQFHNVYTSIVLMTKRTQIQLNGSKWEGELSEDILTVEISGHIYNLEPFLSIITGKIYFFDTYIRKQQSLSVLDYASGKKARIEYALLEQMYQAFSKEIYEAIDSRSVDHYFYTKQEEEMLELFETNESYIKQTYIKEMICEKLQEIDHGVISLQMERGTGKTTFVRSLDELAMATQNLPHTMVRAYYINSTFGSRMQNFISQLSISFLQNKRKEIDIKGDDTNFTWKKQNIKKEFANFLNYQYKLYQERNPSLEKLVFIIDGWDELNIHETEPIQNILPTANLLNPGVFLIVTSRTEQELHSTPHLLKQIKASSTIQISKEDNQSVDLLRQYIKNVYKDVDHEQIELLIETAEYRFLYLKPLMAIRHFISDEKLHNMASIHVNYVNVLKKLYGGKMFRRIQQLLTIIAMSPYPLTIREIQVLSGDPILDFKFIALLNDLKSLFVMNREQRGTTIQLADLQLKEHILNNWKLQITDLITYWEQHYIQYGVAAEIQSEEEMMLIVQLYMAIVEGAYEIKHIPDEEFLKILHKLIFKVKESSLDDDTADIYFTLYRQLLNVHNKYFQVVHPFSDVFFHELAYMYINRGDFSMAITYSSRSIDIAEQLETPFYLKETYLLRAYCKKQLFPLRESITDYEHAYVLHTDEIQTRKPVKQDEVMEYSSSLAYVYKSLGNEKKANEIQQSFIELLCTNEMDFEDKANYYYALAISYHDQENIQQAKYYCEQVLPYLKNDADSNFIWRVYNRYARILGEYKLEDGAMEYFKKAIQIAQDKQMKLQELSSIFYIAQYYEGINLQKTLLSMNRALETFEKIIETEGIACFNINLLNYIVHVNHYLMLNNLKRPKPDFAVAIRYGLQAVEIKRYLSRRNASNPEELAVLLSDVIFAYVKLQQYEKAETFVIHLERILKLASVNQVLPEAVFSYYYTLYMYYNEKHNNTKTSQIAKNCLKIAEKLDSEEKEAAQSKIRVCYEYLRVMYITNSQLKQVEKLDKQYRKLMKV